MPLPERSVCFACGSAGKEQIWAGEGMVLRHCLTCAAEWLEGAQVHQMAYRYETREDADTRYLSGRAARLLSYATRLVSKPGARLLDIGCGTGEFLALTTAAGWCGVGVELTEEAAAIARAETGLQIHVADVASDPTALGGEMFDVVTLWGVIEHEPRSAELLEHSASLVRRGGVLLLETPNPEGLFREVGTAVMALSGGRFQSAFLQTLGAGHVAWYSMKSIRAAAQRMRMDVVDLRGSRNSTEILLERWRHVSTTRRVPFQIATAAINLIAAPIGRPNQIFAALRR